MKLTLNAIRDIDWQMRVLATYKHDAALKDTWRSYATSVLAGKPFAGDCDDWASTVLDMLVRAGAPKDRLYRALVSTDGDVINHFVGIVELDNGERWTIGDTFGPPEPVNGNRAGPHHLLEVSRVSEKLRWRRVALGSMQRETNSASGALRASSAGQAFIRGHEKFVAVPYDDFRARYILRAGDVVRGTLTVGYGHTGADVKIGKKITKAEGEAMFARDLLTFERGVRKAVLVDLQQCEFDALVSFSFNCGLANLRTSTLLKLVNAGAPAHEIQAQFRRWTRSKGVVLPGLVKRRNEEAAMFAGEVVTHGAYEAIFRAPDISPDATVTEDPSAKKSPDVWLAGGGLATGGVTIWTSVQEALRDFRDTIADSNLTLLLSICGVAMAAIAAVLLFKRLAEIRSAKR